MTQVPQTGLLLQQAIKALQQGQPQQALQLFESVTIQAPELGQAWLGLAFARANLQQDAQALEAIERCLALEPRNLRALLFKADHLSRLGQPRRSLPFYEAALKLAVNLNSEIPGDIRQGLERAQSMAERFNLEYADFLLGKLKEKGYQPSQSSTRFNHSLDISMGRKQIYHQQPNRYYFPGLPQRQFYEREEFFWIEELEAATETIRSELEALLKADKAFAPYLSSDQDIPEINQAGSKIVNNTDWGACYLWEYGKLHEENARRCPGTVAALEKVPMAHIPGQMPIALFSRLAAHTHIPPHHGMLNTRLICHLPIIVPNNCGALRCGSEERPWQEGKTLIFDDSIEHEAWNRSDQERVVLLFDIWRPELTEEERQLVSALLQVTKEYEEGD
ncbi:aspartyl/asparaginyl beta-hydroxylase domain-containing protein [Bowmanella dokdonensis]|uniref:Aspartyl/asparaginyl beta-hydroxylase domain-containing protein n=1 Tax=Bowmanella dokdonensis TaxID=751969 RepID=A0A939IPI0_9ALTE|nr:aspartyl/asparaginyl beta-hydroxylase domain-containing protein [Bowmanella dokdonensis]MBN7824009.1 aspartyl/asparaginyl beta-hydroxylase domain-containing protein [Bowmanella dokdonensis]